MDKDHVMRWLLVLGKDWVGLLTIYNLFEDSFDGSGELLNTIDKWCDGAYITKRMNIKNYETKKGAIEQYKLTNKALTIVRQHKGESNEQDNTKRNATTS